MYSEWNRLYRLRKKCFLVIPSEARDLLFFAKPKKKQIPRANPALRNDSLRVFPQPLQPAGVRPCKDQNPQAEARATQDSARWERLKWRCLAARGRILGRIAQHGDGNVSAAHRNQI